MRTASCQRCGRERRSCGRRWRARLLRLAPRSIAPLAFGVGQRHGHCTPLRNGPDPAPAGTLLPVALRAHRDAGHSGVTPPRRAGGHHRRAQVHSGSLRVQGTPPPRRGGELTCATQPLSASGGPELAGPAEPLDRRTPLLRLRPLRRHVARRLRVPAAISVYPLSAIICAGSSRQLPHGRDNGLRGVAHMFAHHVEVLLLKFCRSDGANVMAAGAGEAVGGEPVRPRRSVASRTPRRASGPQDRPQAGGEGADGICNIRLPVGRRVAAPAQAAWRAGRHRSQLRGERSCACCVPPSARSRQPRRRGRQACRTGEVVPQRSARRPPRVERGDGRPRSRAPLVAGPHRGPPAAQQPRGIVPAALGQLHVLLDELSLLLLRRLPIALRGRADVMSTSASWRLRSSDEASTSVRVDFE